MFGYPTYWSGIENRDAYLRNPYYIDPTTTVDSDGQLVNPTADPSNNATGWRVWDSGLTDFQNEKNLLFVNNWRGAFIWTHQLNQSTFYSLRGTYYDYNRLMRVKRWVNEEGYIPRIEHLYRGLEPDPSDPNYGNPVPPTWMFGDEMEQVELRFFPGFGYREDDDELRRYAYQAYTQSGAGTTWDRDGSDRYISNQYDITRSLKGDITSQVSTHHQVKAGAQYNALTLDMFDCQFPWQTTPGISRYVGHPWEFAAYLQDKVEYDFIIMNVGLRYDAASAGPVDYWLSPFNPMYPDTTGLSPDDWVIYYPPGYYEQTGLHTPTRRGTTYSSLAPRLGVSHPVTEFAVIYFNYGLFYQRPIYRNVYRLNDIRTGNTITGNPLLELEKTVSYEFGYKHQFTDILALEVTLWAKDQSNMVGTQRIPPWYHGVVNPYEYSVAINYDYGHSRGFDLQFRKRYSNYWSARFNYSYMLSEGNREYEWAGYHAEDEGRIERQPKRAHTMWWDQPHRFTADLSVQIPGGAGPEIFGFRPLQHTSVHVIYSAEAGIPYTPVDENNNQLELNSERLPWTYRMDLRFYRDFSSFGVRYSIFADVRNLSDRRNVAAVFSETGRADDPGPNGTDYTDEYDRSEWYGTPRRITLGLRIYF
ncbi:TonB-dependent receptor plug domain-containing protein [Gemmatimonadota bacterium]